MDRGGRFALGRRHADAFDAGTLFGDFARTVCEAECLAAKELFEAWEVAKRVRRHLRGGVVVDLAAGHGVAAWALLVMEGGGEAVCVDRRVPESAGRLAAVLGARWPGVRVRFEEGDLRGAEVPEGARVLGVHACGGLTDAVIGLAVAARAGVAVLPCCHAHGKQDDGGLAGWMDRDVAIDATRARRLAAAGYRVWTTTIDAAITPEHRLLVGRPD
ncbi:MAG: methyltransferase domain-containing protein [Alphaproteobacteria bacterium]|nr:methyltransferase domain-containing protein [Alphaproteobacteria bacterium]